DRHESCTAADSFSCRLSCPSCLFCPSSFSWSFVFFHVVLLHVVFFHFIFLILVLHLLLRRVKSKNWRRGSQGTEHSDGHQELFHEYPFRSWFCSAHQDADAPVCP